MMSFTLADLIMVGSVFVGLVVWVIRLERATVFNREMLTCCQKERIARGAAHDLAHEVIDQKIEQHFQYIMKELGFISQHLGLLNGKTGVKQ